MPNYNNSHPADYLETLQDIALGFLRRHEAEHLGEQELFSRAIQHLTSTMKANQALAENTVARAYGQLKQTADPRFVDLSASTSNMLMVVDPRNHLHYAVPIKAVLACIIDAAERPRLSVVRPTSH